MLAFFGIHYVCESHAIYLGHFNCYMVFYYMNISLLLIHFAANRHLHRYQVGAITNNAAVNTLYIF